MKRLLQVAAGILLLLVIALAAIPLFFGGAIERRVAAALERRVDAQVTYDDIDLGLFRHFPNLAVTVDALTVTGVGAFAGDTLAHADRFRVVVGLGSAIGAVRRGDPVVVRSVHLAAPLLRARVLEDGRASWDILKALGEVSDGEPAVAASSDLRLDLRLLEIEEGRVDYDDDRRGLHTAITGLSHTMAGDLGADRFVLRSRADAESVTLRHAGVPYLTGARVAVEADIDADVAGGRFTLRENRVAVNELAVSFDGSLRRLEEGAEVDLTFAADRAGFRDILSLVPAFFTDDMAGLEADGAVAVNGYVRGRTGGDAVPSFAVNALVENGRFRYDDLRVPVTDVFLDLAVRQPAAELDSTVVDVERLAFSVEGTPFMATFGLSTPVSDPELTAVVDGRLDLAAVGDAVKLEGIEELAGEVVADASIHARRSWVEAEAYERVEAAGRLALTDVVVAGDAVPEPITIETLTLELSPRHVDVPVFRGSIGASDMEGSARIDNLLGFLLSGGVLRGRAELRSRYVALDEWKREDPRALEIIAVPGNVDLAVSTDVDSMTFGWLVMTEARGDLRVQDRRVTLDDFGIATLGGEIVLRGWYETVDPDRPAFDLALGIAGIDIPGAFEALNTVRALAPAARYATGTFSSDLAVRGIVGGDMEVALPTLNGEGGIRTRGLGVQGVPALDRLAEAVRVEALRSPTVSDFAASLQVRDGRLHVRPFTLRLGPGTAAVSGSNGIDGSLSYTVGLQLPRSALGSEANRVIGGLIDRAGRAGLRLSEAEAVQLEAAIGGTFQDPSVTVNLAEALTAAGADLAGQARTRLQEEADRQAAEARERVERARLQAEEEARSRLEGARKEARVRADSIIAAATVQADRIRAEAERAATQLRDEADRRARRLVAEAENPLARRAAEAARNRLRQEADRRATQLTGEADRRANQVLRAAREQADRLTANGGPTGDPSGDPAGD